MKTSDIKRRKNCPIHCAEQQQKEVPKINEKCRPQQRISPPSVQPDPLSYTFLIEGRVDVGAK
jgi:hypothetical protein